MFSNKYRYLFILALAVYTYASTVLCDVYFYFKLDIEWYAAFTTIFLITLLSWEGSRLLQPKLYYIYKIHQAKIKYLIWFFVAGSFFTTLATVAVIGAVSMVWHKHTLQETILPLKLNLIYAWLANLLFHLVNAIKFYLEEYKTKLIEAEEQKKLTAMAELNLIKNQINPHFLFNNLNVLSTLVMNNNGDANKFIEEFSKVYRYILSVPQKELVPLSEELAFIEPYMFLLKKRFSNSLFIELNISEACKNNYIIPASLQLLIENAIKHNVVSVSKPLRINVDAKYDSSIVVKNNLQPKISVEMSTKVGLQNITKRYEMVSGRTVEVRASAEMFSVRLPLLSLN